LTAVYIFKVFVQHMQIVGYCYLYIRYIRGIFVWD